MTNIARRARWPWVALGVFISFAIVGLILVVVNGESIAEQVPYVIAFTLFGVVGALLLSRLRGNRIGGLLLFGAAITGASFAGAELATYLASEGSPRRSSLRSDGCWASSPSSSSCRCCSRTDTCRHAVGCLSHGSASPA